ncbi:MAG TPA: deoxyribose-phosphate aldolase [Candidatus Sulfotelmatobacter sp.]|nr:deoxyribose-phosphate aldolase [Candidatus Sulfotelmatobacter sp.]
MSSTETQANRKPDQSEGSQLASRIQHTLISNVLTESLWESHIADCLKYGFHAAMIPPAWVKRTAERLRGTGVRTASFIDFPYGAMTSAGKADEAKHLVDAGVEEIDLMPNVGFLLSGMEDEYADEIHRVVKAADKVLIKIMLELPLLNAEQRERAVKLSIEAGVAYLKNASGGAVGIATPEDMSFLRRLAPPHIRVKASGGIKTAQQVRDLLAAGADLVGTSSGVRIMQELQNQESQSQEPQNVRPDLSPPDGY